MLKILANSRKLLVTTILYTLYWCDITEAQSTSDVIQHFLQVIQNQLESSNADPKQRHNDIGLDEDSRNDNHTNNETQSQQQKRDDVQSNSFCTLESNTKPGHEKNLITISPAAGDFDQRRDFPVVIPRRAEDQWETPLDIKKIDFDPTNKTKNFGQKSRHHSSTITTPSPAAVLDVSVSNKSKHSEKHLNVSESGQSSKHEHKHNNKNIANNTNDAVLTGNKIIFKNKHKKSKKHKKVPPILKYLAPFDLGRKESVFNLHEKQNKGQIKQNKHLENDRNFKSDENLDNKLISKANSKKKTHMRGYNTDEYSNKKSYDSMDQMSNQDDEYARTMTDLISSSEEVTKTTPIHKKQHHKSGKKTSKIINSRTFEDKITRTTIITKAKPETRSYVQQSNSMSWHRKTTKKTMSLGTKPNVRLKPYASHSRPQNYDYGTERSNPTRPIEKYHNKKIKADIDPEYTYIKPERNREEIDIVRVKHKKKLRKEVLTESEETHNILRSTRMTPASGQDEEEEERPKETTPKNSKSSEEVEVMSPYAIQNQLKRFAEKYKKDYSANVTTEVIGRTVEYNNIVLLKIAEMSKEYSFRVKDEKFADEKPEKKIIFIVHGLTVAGMRQLLEDESYFHTLMGYYLKHLDKFDFYIIPMANPDGYAANSNSHAEMYWNKNMSPQSGCAGVVLDRNFDVAWNSSHNIHPCSHLFPGPVPFSEAETTAIRDVLHLHSHQIEAYIHVHASSHDTNIFKGEAILYPYGYTDSSMDDDKYIDLKGEVEEVMKNASFKIVSVTVETLYNWYGKVTGSSVDYAAAVYGVPFAMEFAMQLYVGGQHNSLTQIWKRLINVVFKNIWKGVNKKDEDRK